MKLLKPLRVRWFSVAPSRLPETKEMVLGFYSSTNSHGNLSNGLYKVLARGHFWPKMIKITFFLHFSYDAVRKSYSNGQKWAKLTKLLNFQTTCQKNYEELRAVPRVTYRPDIILTHAEEYGSLGGRPASQTNFVLADFGLKSSSLMGKTKDYVL